MHMGCITGTSQESAIMEANGLQLSLGYLRTISSCSLLPMFRRVQDLPPRKFSASLACVSQSCLKTTMPIKMAATKTADQ